ncbi:hypothetical protein PMZ80_005025 [Knufia obscura]|uniref:Uncharacterized protein n=1 Tax=Knufia obscura TaxID=1635080 RepID=A0ABR0RPG7_9EURO|nr:hypothetical protein PMZ80_005025 [Knufia obscura]
MSRGTDLNSSQRPKPRFMHSTEASRTQKSARTPSSRQSASPTLHSSPISKRRHIFQRATGRLASLSAFKARSGRLPISPPISPSPSKESSLRLPSPSRRYSHIPQPIKKDSLPSPTDKPLPSIPVATFVSRSPIHRRSLLDATEKPLRRSVSPGTLEDWPTLSPIKAHEPQELSSSPNMVSATTPVKPSLGESVIERMRKLDLNDEPIRHLNNARSTTSFSKAQPQNYTPKIHATTHHNGNSTTQKEHYAGDAKFFDPRPAPETPRAAKQDRTSTGSTIDRRLSLRGLNILKTRRSSRSSVGKSTPEDPAEGRPPSSFIPQPSVRISVGDKKDIGSSRKESVKRKPVTSSSIPRPLRSVTDAGSPYMNTAQASPKVIQLKRAQGQVADILQKQNGIAQEHPKYYVRPAWGLGPDQACSSPSPRSSSLPLPGRNEPRPTVSAMTMLSSWMQPDPCEDEDDERKASTSSSTTIKKEPVSSPLSSPVSTPTRKASLKENIPPAEHNSDEDLSPVRNFKFPAVIPIEEEGDDSRSDITRVTSMSSASKAGTIYAQDERGGYRLKPVSKTDPKNGPRVRVEDSADQLLLTDAQLAEVEAKREAYQRKFSAHLMNGQEKEVIPELASLQYSSNSHAHPERKAEIHESQTNGQTTAPSKTRLAPPVPANISTLSHSPTGWPLHISKIAPFAEVESSHPSPKRKSASESNLRARPGTPPPLPDGPGPAYESSPASAYTLKTALNHIPRADAIPVSVSRTGGLRDKMTKPRKSLPNITGARLRFPPRTSSELDDPSPLHNLRKQTSALLSSYVDQRADFSPKGETPSDKLNGHTGAGTGPNHVNGHGTVTTTTTPPTSSAHRHQLKHIQTYNSSLRNLNTHQNIAFQNDLPSSPPAIPGTVQTGKAKMMSTMRGLMHKISREGGLSRSGSGSEMKASVVYHSGGRRGSDAAAAGEYKSSPLALRSPDGASALQTRGGDASGNGNDNDMGSSIEKSLPTKAKRTLGLSRLAHGHGMNTNPNTHSTKHDGDDTDSTSPFLTSVLEPLEIRSATALAFSLLDRARDTNANANNNNSGSGNGQAEYVELAKVIVATVTLARDAEKAMEEAKQAAARAEMKWLRRVEGMVNGRRKEEGI